MTAPKPYTSHFTNRYGEEWEFECDPSRREGILRGSDIDWQEYRVIEGRAALERLPKNTPAYEHLALALWGQGRPQEALGAAGEGIATFPGMAGIRVVRSRILESERRIDEALQDLCKALELDPVSAKAHEALRDLLARLDRPVRLPESDRILKILEDAVPGSRQGKRVAGTIAALRGAMTDPPAGAGRTEPSRGSAQDRGRPHLSKPPVEALGSHSER